MSEVPPEVKSLEAVSIHLWHIREQQSEILRDQAEMLRSMATHDDINGIRATIATLATRAEVDQKIGELHAELERTKPATLGRQIVVICAGILTVIAFVGVIAAVIRAIDRYQPPIISVAPIAKETTK